MQRGSNKVRLYRIMKIITVLTAGNKKWTAKKLSKEFKVSKRTIYRDKKLMEELGIPIYYDRQEGSYKIKNTFHFVPPNLTEKEARALLLAAREHEEKFIYSKELDAALNKVMSALPTSFKNRIKNWEDRITYIKSPHIDFSVHENKIRELERAIENRRTIKIHYFSLNSGETTTRKVNPYKIFLNSGAAYLVGFCHKRDEKRIFRVDRIRSIVICRSQFEIPENFSLKDYLDSAFNVERGEKREVVLRFKGTASYLVREVGWHETQEVEEISEDEIIFKITTGSRAELKSWILSYGREVEVIKPQELRQEVRNEIEKMKEIYEKTDTH